MENWTVKDGKSNDSDLYAMIVNDVNSIIRESAGLLLAGESHAVSRQIVSRLAHVYKLYPEKGSMS